MRRGGEVVVEVEVSGGLVDGWGSSSCGARLSVSCVDACSDALSRVVRNTLVVSAKGVEGRCY